MLLLNLSNFRGKFIFIARVRISMFDGSSDCVPCSDISSSPERTIILFFQNKLSKSSKQSL